MPPPLASQIKESVALLDDEEKSHRIIQDKAQLSVQSDASVFIIDGYDSTELEKKYRTEGITTGLYRSVAENPRTPSASGAQVKSSAFGNECGVTVGDWMGYHSKPHFHDCEQINYILDGEIWFFVGDRGFHCHAGDFLRVPSGGTHWAWHRSDKPVTIGQVYSPPFLQPSLEKRRAALFDYGEAPRLAGIAVHIDIEQDREKTERALGLR